MKLKALALAVAALVATPVAASAQNWTGCHVGVGAGVAVADTTTDLTTPLAPVGLTIDGFSGSGAMAAFGLGCDIQTGRFVFGAFADYDWHNETETTLSLALGGLGASAKFGIDSAWTVGGRMGALVTPTTLVYGLVGYSQAQTTGLDLALGGAGTTIDLKDLSGWVVGAGVEAMIFPNWTLKGEYRYAMYEAETTPLIPSVLDIKNETDVHTVRAVLSYRFNFGGGSEETTTYKSPLK